MKPHEEWLFKAEHDIESASILLLADNPLYDISIYHTQQCAEKSLKAYLAFNEKEIEKTHNLKTLAENCMEINSNFNDILDDCIFLSPYAILYRYPEGDLMPAKETVIQAIATANKIMDFIKNKIDAKH